MFVRRDRMGDQQMVWAEQPYGAATREEGALMRSQELDKRAGYQLDEEREKAYEQGKREGSKSILDRLNSNQNPPGRQSSGQAIGQTSQGEKLTPKQEYEKLLHDAAMTDNMVEGKKQNDNGNSRHDRSSDPGSDLFLQHMADARDLSQDRSE
jgi:hypothetical protein